MSTQNRIWIYLQITKRGKSGFQHRLTCFHFSVSIFAHRSKHWNLNEIENSEYLLSYLVEPCWFCLANSILLPNCTHCPGLCVTREILHKQQPINENCECLLSVSSFSLWQREQKMSLLMEEDYCQKKACAFPVIYCLVDLQTEIPRGWNSDFALHRKAGCLFTLPDLPNYA